MEFNEFNRAVMDQEITHEQAEEAALRIIAGAFNRTDKRPQLSIPPRPDDDDIILMEYLRRQKSPWRDIESAPRDGTPILCVKNGGGFQPEILHFEDGVFGWLTDDMGFGCHPNRQPTHWMPLQEPPR